MSSTAESATAPHVRSLSVVLLCYNDAPTIAELVETARRTLAAVDVDFEIIAVNDGSADESAAVLATLQARAPELRVITHERNRGYGGAVISGFAHATMDWVFYTDGDGQYDPSELVKLLALATSKVDVVQGYKTARADGITRAVLGETYRRTVKRWFGLAVRDTDCDFRLIRRSTLHRVSLRETSGAFCVELVRKLQDAGARFVEVGVHHYPRRYGRSQFLRPGAVAQTMVALARLKRELRRATAVTPEVAPTP